MKRTNLIAAAGFILLTSLLFTACVKENNTEYPDVTATSDTIFGTLKYKQPESTGGKIVAWPYGEATFKVIVGASEVIASAPVNADGTFKAILPASMSGAFLSSLADIAKGQGGTLAAVPNTIRFAGTFQYKVEYTYDGTARTIITNLYKLKADNTIEKSYFYNFYDSNGTFKGTSYTGNIFNWSFLKGWGLVESYTTNTTTTAFNSSSVATPASSAVWVNL